VRTALETEKLDVNLVVKKDGEEMLDWMKIIEAGKAERPEIVLLDLNLPKYSGAVLLENMRRSHTFDDVPVVVVTSSDSPKDREVAFRYHASSYFRKPSDYDEFMRLGGIVRSLLTH
jgi:DNA-binding response OmpR family regulator